MSGKKNTREDILNAAESVVAESGSAHLTLDAVAVCAGVSKGGLLYHFPTKEALIQGMVMRLGERMMAEKERAKSNLEDSPSQEIKAHIHAWTKRSEHEYKVATALLAAGAHDSALLDPVRKLYQESFAKYTAKGLSFETAAVISLALDGLWFMQILNMLPFEKGSRDKIVKKLIELAENG